MAGNPWGEKSQDGDVESLQSIMKQECEQSDCNLALELHHKLNMAAVSSPDCVPLREDTAGQSSSNETTESDEMFARRLQAELNGNTDTLDDALLAAMLQQDIDKELLAEEKHRNGNCKVTMSAYQGTYQEQAGEISEEEENSFFEIEEAVPDKTKTKHDKEANIAKNHKKISDKFNLEFNTGDFRGISVPHKVYNALQVEAHKSKFNGIRVKDRRDISTHEKVMGRKTRVVMLKMLNSGIVKNINGIVNTVKESVIIHCDGGRMKSKGVDVVVPAECVLKIHKTSLNEFSRRRDYIDRRYTKWLGSKTKNLIQVWALKEVHNLHRLRRAGILCPEVVAHRKQLILLSFIGSNGVPAPTLHEAVFSSTQLKSAYEQLIAGMKTMFHKCKLVHGDLSEYNLLWCNGALHFIDLSQAVLTDHSSALTYLYRDCLNMCRYFADRHLKNVLEAKQLFCEVTELDVPCSDEASFLTRIEHLQRNEVHEFKHGDTTSDYAFNASFNETRPLSSDSEVSEEGVLLLTSDDEEEEEEEESCEPPEGARD